MIKSNELRLGNYLLGYDNNYFTWNYRHYDLCSKGIYADELGMPIELTEEILLKCGFKYDEHKKYQELILPNSHQELIGFTFQGEFRLHYRVLKITLNDIKYLHQLQNLYFALTNKELEINL